MSSRRRHARCALVTGVQTCALPFSETLEAEGAHVSRAVWDGTWSAEQFRVAFDDMDVEDRAINYVTFAAGTVIPKGESPQGAAGHMNTWRIAHNIAPIREWIFRQRRAA